jgi:hypothetical protein
MQVKSRFQKRKLAALFERQRRRLKNASRSFAHNFYEFLQPLSVRLMEVITAANS